MYDRERGQVKYFILCCWCFRACLTFESVLLFSVCKISRDIRRELWCCMELFGFPWSFSSIVDMWSHKHSSCNSTRKRCNLLLKSRCKLYDIAVLFGETPIKDGWKGNICMASQLAYLVTSSHKHSTCNIGFHLPSSSWPSSQSSRIHATASQRIKLIRIN